MALIEVDELEKLKAVDVSTSAETLLKGKRAGVIELERVASGVSSPELPRPTSPAPIPVEVLVGFWRRALNYCADKIMIIVITIIGGLAVLALASWFGIS